MKITIEESLTNLKELQKDYKKFHDDVWQDPESYGIIAESLKVAISTIHKYQKIQEVMDSRPDDSAKSNSKALGEIEVIMYGNVD